MVKNNIRKLLLGLILLLVTLSAYSLIKSLNKQSLPVEALKLMSKNVDIEIQNFKVTHEGEGGKEWEIKAKEAKVRNKENLIILSEVDVTMNMSHDRITTISADSGIIDRETNDIQLEGNVKFKADADNFFESFQKSDEAATEPESK